MREWEKDKRWSDRFLHQIKGILGVHLIGEPPAEEDAERNTDLMVLRMDAVRIACRIRKNNYLQRYGDEFTIRAGRPSGVKTELTKIIEGWGDYFFYGFSDDKEQQLCKWVLADMRVFRRHYALMLTRLPQNQIPGIRKQNHDYSSSFVSFKWQDFPPEFIAAKSEVEKEPMLF